MVYFPWYNVHGLNFFVNLYCNFKMKKKNSHLTLRAPVTILLTVPRSQVASSVYLIPDPPSYISSYDIQICDKSITGNGVREEACWWPMISPHFVHCKEQNKWSEMLLRSFTLNLNVLSYCRKQILKHTLKRYSKLSLVFV